VSRRSLPAILLAAAFALVAIAVWRAWPTAGPDAPPAETANDAAESPPDVEPELAPLPRQGVLVYFPGVEGEALVGEEREIFATAAPGDRAKQILADLLAGPATPAAGRAVPPGTRLNQIYVLDSGVAYLDFSEELAGGIGGGSQVELLTVYAIVDSVALNVSEIKRVGILIHGRPVETLSGHVDLRRPLPPDRSWIATEGEDAILVNLTR
jgi:spore germination protein GerM